MRNDDFFLGFFFSLAIVVVIEIVVAYLLYQGLQKIPEKYRTTEPHTAWLTVVPLAGVVFYWILLPYKIPESFKNYFAENPGNGKTPKDYGKAMGLGAVISATFLLIPVINLIAWIPALIFLVLFMVQFTEMEKQLPSKNGNASMVSQVSHFIGEQLNRLNSRAYAKAPQATKATKASHDKFTQLERLKQLLDQDILTAEEYQSEKRKILQDHERPG